MNHKTKTALRIGASAKLAMRGHYTCEDAWYSCHLSPEGSANEFKPSGVCDCGAQEHNAEVKSLLDEYIRLTANGPLEAGAEAAERRCSGSPL